MTYKKDYISTVTYIKEFILELYKTLTLLIMDPSVYKGPSGSTQQIFGRAYPCRRYTIAFLILEGSYKVGARYPQMLTAL